MHGRCTIAGWVDWSKLLSKEKQQPEAFRCYLHAACDYTHPTLPFKSKVPLQVMAYHVGGQGIAVKSFSLFCLAMGYQITCTPTATWCQQVECASHLLLHKYDLKQTEKPFSSGWGSLQMLSITTSALGIAAQHWYGVGFSSENIGVPLYQSVKLNESGWQVYEKVRHLILISLHKAWSMGLYGNMKLAYTPYYEVRGQFWEHAFALTFSCLVYFSESVGR